MDDASALWGRAWRWLPTYGWPSSHLTRPSGQAGYNEKGIHAPPVGTYEARIHTCHCAHGQDLRIYLGRTQLYSRTPLNRRTARQCAVWAGVGMASVLLKSTAKYSGR